MTNNRPEKISQLKGNLKALEKSLIYRKHLTTSLMHLRDWFSYYGVTLNGGPLYILSSSDSLAKDLFSGTNETKRKIHVVEKFT